MRAAVRWVTTVKRAMKSALATIIHLVIPLAEIAYAHAVGLAPLAMIPARKDSTVMDVRSVVRILPMGTLHVITSLASTAVSRATSAQLASIHVPRERMVQNVA